MDKDTLDSSDELKYWLTLTFIKDIGPITVKKLLSVFRTPRNILEAPLKELQKAEDAKITQARAIYAFHSWDLVDLELSKIGKLGIGAITFADKSYPESLRQIDDSPILLYIKGTITDEDR